MKEINKLYNWYNKTKMYKYLENNFISLYKPSISLKEVKNVNTCLKDGWISSKGKFVSSFEALFKKSLVTNLQQ